MDDEARKAETQALIARAGGPAAVGRMFDPPITPQAVSQWMVVPPNRCLGIETGSEGKVTRYQMRPDIFGEAPQAEAA